ncbi:bacteriohemerythrin [Acinetobacter baumannii]
MDVIDEQHKRILDYINEIDDVKDDEDRRRIKDVLDNIIDYTQSHLHLKKVYKRKRIINSRVPHKRVHDLFIKKIELYRERFEMGHTIEAELQEILAKWLINHIQHDDADYVGGSKRKYDGGLLEKKKRRKEKNWFARFFS